MVVCRVLAYGIPIALIIALFYFYFGSFNSYSFATINPYYLSDFNYERPAYTRINYGDYLDYLPRSRLDCDQGQGPGWDRAGGPCECGYYNC
jgi:hypothetical protein